MPVDALTPAAGRQVTQASGVLRTIGPPCCPRGAGELDGVEQLHAVHASRVNAEIRREPQASLSVPRYSSTGLPGATPARWG